MKITSGTVLAVTGASRGIGKEFALLCARRGAKMILLSRDERRLREVSAEVERLGGTAMHVACDVSKEEDCRAWIQPALARFGRIDALVNNAGYGHYASVERLQTEELERIFKTNLFGSFWCIQAVLPHFKERRQGHIVNVSTVISKRSLPFMTAYCMTKFALNALDEGLRLEVKPYNIDVSLVCPGLTATDFQSNAAHIDYSPPALSSRGGMRPEKVAGAIFSAIERRRKRVELTLNGKLMICMNKVAPGFVDFVLEHAMVHRHLANKEPQ